MPHFSLPFHFLDTPVSPQIIFNRTGRGHNRVTDEILDGDPMTLLHPLLLVRCPLLLPWT